MNDTSTGVSRYKRIGNSTFARIFRRAHSVFVVSSLQSRSFNRKEHVPDFAELSNASCAASQPEGDRVGIALAAWTPRVAQRCRRLTW